MSMKFSGFDDSRSRRFVQNVKGSSRTLQNFKDECNINNIMKKFERTGMLNHARQYEGGYGDFTDAPVDFQEAMNIVLDAEKMFATVPAKVRKEFDNDPGKFLAFVDDPKNLDRARELGLAMPAPVEEAPMRVEVVNPAAPDESGNSST